MTFDASESPAYTLLSQNQFYRDLHTFGVYYFQPFIVTYREKSQNYILFRFEDIVSKCGFWDFALKQFEEI